MIESNGQARNSFTTSIRKKIGNYSYATTDQLGSGYSSQVFQGTDDSNSRPVALKVLPLAITRSKGLEGLLVQEIQLLREISHDNVIRCLEVLMTSNNCYIVTELCQDGDLASLLTRKGKLPISEGLPLALQIAKGLAYLHSLHILHRDVKPQNILLSGSMAKLADLGFAIRSEKPTVEKYSIGTPLYMSPQALQLKQYSPKNDVWALGVTLYEMMEGRPPWNAPNEKELKLSIKGQLRFRNIRCSELQHLIKGCLTYESTARWEAKQVVEKLQAMLKTEQGSENKQNQLRCNETEPQSEQLKKSMRNNYELLKWLVNYSRFSAKLLPKLQNITCSSFEQQPFVELAARTLHLAISKLNRVDQLHSQLNLQHYPHFRRTTRFSKIQAVAKEYHNKYLLLLTKLPFKYSHPATLALPWPAQLAQNLCSLPIHAESEQAHLVALQELLTLIEVNHRAQTANPHSLAQSIDFDQLLSTPTPQPSIESLTIRRQNLLAALSSSQQ